MGEEQKGEQLVLWMEEKLSAVARRLASVPADRRLSVMDYNTWSTSMGRGSSWDEIVRLAGLSNTVAGLAADRFGQVPISRETLLTLDPDILLLPGGSMASPAARRSFGPGSWEIPRCGA